MRRAWRAALVAALILAVVAAPGLASLTTAAPSREAARLPAPAAEDKQPLRGGTAHVRLLGVNDLHGYLESPCAVDGRRVGGAAHLAAYLDRHGRGSGRTIRVHAGDMVGASPLISARFHDEPTVTAMNEMGFDVGALGNHEFDEGRAEMLRLVRGGQKEDSGGDPAASSDPDYPGAAFPYLAANTIDRKTGRPVLPPHTVLQRDGVKVGFIGVTTLETPDIIIPDAATDFRFVDISRTVNRHAAKLKGRGVETIVVLAHSGALDTARGGTADEIVAEARQMDPAVDVIFSGHTHNRLNLRVAGKRIVQSEEYGSALGVVDLEVDRASGDVTGSRARVLTTYHDRARPDPRVAAIVQEYRRRVAPLSRRVVGEADETYSVAVNGFLAAGGGDFRAFTEGENARAVGTDVGALVAHAGRSPQPFTAPDPRQNPRVEIGAS